MAYRPPRITPTTFAYSSCSSPRTSSRSPPITIFFIPGNPGLISYYHTFLSLLSSYLSLGPQSSAQLQDKRGTKSPDENADRKTTGIENLNGNGNTTSTASSNTSASFTSITPFQIYGRNLGGFDTDNNTIVDEGSQEMSGDISIGGESKVSVKLYGLEEQIGFVQNVLEDFMSRVPPGNVDGDSEDAFLKPRVILMGHSVGSYIAMEVLRRHREKDKETNGVYVDQATGFDIIGGIMLFPTIVDIAKSASGRKLTTLLYFIPQLALVASFFARLLTLFLPDAVLRFLIGAVMRSPPPEAIETTLAFLKSRNGVKQAIHMASSEMQIITSDKWTDDIWGVSTAREPLSKLFFYFGCGDHWVADRTRDEIIELRGRTEKRNGPEMFVCEDGLPHAFCLRHNDIMARKVAGMIEDIAAAAHQ